MRTAANNAHIDFVPFQADGQAMADYIKRYGLEADWQGWLTKAGERVAYKIPAKDGRDFQVVWVDPAKREMVLNPVTRAARVAKAAGTKGSASFTLTCEGVGDDSQNTIAGAYLAQDGFREFVIDYLKNLVSNAKFWQYDEDNTDPAGADGHMHIDSVVMDYDNLTIEADFSAKIQGTVTYEYATNSEFGNDEVRSAVWYALVHAIEDKVPGGDITIDRPVTAQRRAQAADDTKFVEGLDALDEKIKELSAQRYGRDKGEKNRKSSESMKLELLKHVATWIRIAYDRGTFPYKHTNEVGQAILDNLDAPENITEAIMKYAKAEEDETSAKQKEIESMARKTAEGWLAQAESMLAKAAVVIRPEDFEGRYEVYDGDKLVRKEADVIQVLKFIDKNPKNKGKRFKIVDTHPKYGKTVYWDGSRIIEEEEAKKDATTAARVTAALQITKPGEGYSKEAIQGAIAGLKWEDYPADGKLPYTEGYAINAVRKEFNLPRPSKCALNGTIQPANDKEGQHALYGINIPYKNADLILYIADTGTETFVVAKDERWKGKDNEPATTAGKVEFLEVGDTVRFSYPGHSFEGKVGEIVGSDFKRTGVGIETVYQVEGEGIDPEDADSWATADELERVTAMKATATIRKEADGYHVRSKEGKNLGGPYKTEEEAKDRLKQVETFKHKKAAAEKEPWQMTQNEWRKQWLAASKAENKALKSMPSSPQQKSYQWGSTERIRLEYGAESKPLHRRGFPVITHESVVRKALSEGKPVPAEVLADYPDLAKPAITTTRVTASYPKRMESGSDDGKGLAKIINDTDKWVIIVDGLIGLFDTKAEADRVWKLPELQGDSPEGSGDELAGTAFGSAEILPPHYTPKYKPQFEKDFTQERKVSEYQPIDIEQYIKKYSKRSLDRIRDKISQQPNLPERLKLKKNPDPWSSANLFGHPWDGNKENKTTAKAKPDDGPTDETYAVYGDSEFYRTGDKFYFSNEGRLVELNDDQADQLRAFLAKNTDVFKTEKEKIDALRKVLVDDLGLIKRKMMELETIAVKAKLQESHGDRVANLTRKVLSLARAVKSAYVGPTAVAIHPIADQIGVRARQVYNETHTDNWVTVAIDPMSRDPHSIRAKIDEIERDVRDLKLPLGLANVMANRLKDGLRELKKAIDNL